MINRKLDLIISDFYENHHNMALMLDGARQVGKTVAFRRYAESHFQNYVEINFVKNEAARSIFNNAAGVDDIMLRLSSFTRTKLVPGKTFILLDEVQKCPECVTMIKFLVEDGRYTYGLTGSLLGVELKDIVRSFPVGFMDIIDVFPLDFEEFANTVGVAPSVLEHLKTCYEEEKPVDSFVHDQMMRLFQIYLVVGGMPAAVDKYVQTNDIQKVSSEHEAILRLYKRDIAQYDPDQKLYLNEIFDLIPSELNAKNKRFILKKLNENAKYARYENSFLWLKNAGVAIPVFNVEEPKVPLLLSKQRNLFKLFQNDVGLLVTQLAKGIQLKILSGEVNINYGSIYENVVAQELLSHGYSSLYYFNSKKQGELDFLLETRDGIVLPVEVKSGKDYQLHAALTNVLGNEQYNTKKGVVLCNDNLSRDGNILNIPIYMVMFLKQEGRIDESMILKPDLSGLK